jgi:hypothetical protein
VNEEALAHWGLPHQKHTNNKKYEVLNKELAVTLCPTTEVWGEQSSLFAW